MSMTFQVDFYLESCAARGDAPNKPYTGRFVVRVSPELHGAIAIAAKRDRKSINAWVAEACESRVGL